MAGCRDVKLIVVEIQEEQNSMSEISIKPITEKGICNKQENIESILPIDEYTFENFIIAESNKLAYASALAVAGGDKKQLFNPLFIYGSSGLGKTHLLHAIWNFVKKQNPQSKIIYKTSDEFMGELFRATRQSKTSEFRDNYTYADYFLMDDSCFISGKPGTQLELLKIFNILFESGTQVVFVSDKSANGMHVFEHGLRTSFHSCLIADIRPPEKTLCKAIVKQKAQQLGVALPENIIAYIVANAGTNIWHLEGAVKTIISHRDIMDEEITGDSVVKHLKLLFKDKKEYNITRSFMLKSI